MIKLIDILKEITEAKQVGNLYHFTPLKNIIPMLDSQVLIPNMEGQISTTRRPDMDISGFMKMQMGKSNTARLMLDGDKISTKYKIRPFVYFDDYEYEDGEDLGEEQIIINKKNFYFLPYLKRIDIFITKKEKNIDKITMLLDKMDIPYKIYEGTPQSNIPYKQSKEGDPSNIKYTPLDKLPDNSVISKDLYLSNISSIPENLTVNGDLHIEDSNNIKLPIKLTVKGQLWVKKCNITSLPKELTVKGLTIADTPITSLPEKLVISNPKISILSFFNTNLSSLPDNLTTNSLRISKAPIDSIPNNLNVSFITLIDTPLNEKYTVEELKKIIEDKGGKIFYISDKA
jgi:hypothetical protein